MPENLRDWALPKAAEFSATAGATQYKTKFIQTVPIDPAIAALIQLLGSKRTFLALR